MKRTVCFGLISASILCGGIVTADDDWKKEFETVCCQTDNAMSLTDEQLKEYIERCDRIKPAIEALEPSPRKVYLKRWKLCRELFQYVLDTRKVPLPRK